MFKSNKVNHMTVIVKGVRDDDYDNGHVIHFVALKHIVFSFAFKQ